MYRVVVGVGAVGVAVAIALGARQNLPRRQDADATPVQIVRAHPSPRQATPATARVPAAAATASASASAPPPEAGGVRAQAPAAAAADVEPRAAQAAAPDADALLQRASAAYGRVRTLSASFVQVMNNPLLGGTTTSRGQLYQRRPDRFLMRFSQPAGDVIVSDGRYFWVYYPSVDRKQVMRMPASAAGGGMDLQAQFLGDPGKRFAARLLGKESVAGRPASILLLTPRSPTSFKQLKVWVDQGDALVRRFEITEQNGSVRRLELSGLKINAPLSDALFRFTPPAGAQVVTRG